MNKEQLNHLAYEDVLLGNAPSSENEYYMQCYQFWLGIARLSNPYYEEVVEDC
jgi:hypothetical protein